MIFFCGPEGLTCPREVLRHEATSQLPSSWFVILFSRLICGHLQMWGGEKALGVGDTWCRGHVTFDASNICIVCAAVPSSPQGTMFPLKPCIYSCRGTGAISRRLLDPELGSQYCLEVRSPTRLWPYSPTPTPSWACLALLGPRVRLLDLLNQLESGQVLP